MPMSEDERRRLRELENQLAQQPRLVKLARQLSAASVYTGTRRLAIATAAGGALGLILLIAGAVTHTGALVTSGIAILGGTQIVVGVSAIVVEVRGYRRERRTWLPPAHALRITSSRFPGS